MIQLDIDKRIVDICPEVKIGIVRAHVTNGDTSDELWQEIEEAAESIQQRYELLEVNQRPAIAATRRLYKALGKDPGRYRVASEQLCRRVIRGLDADKIVGNRLTMGVGNSGEEYHGIGRGLLNIEGMPVYRDEIGGVATPTSDEERTKFSTDTTHVQICINAFAPEMPLEETVEWMVSLLRKYADVSDIETVIKSEF